MKITCLILKSKRWHLLFWIIFSMIPSTGLAQTLYGDPTLTLGKAGAGKVEVGGGTFGQSIILDGTTIRLRTSTQNVTWNVSQTSVKIEGEDVFLSASLGLGKTGDFFAKVGQTKFSSPFDSDYSLAYGYGIRLSPQQSGKFKVGLLIQAQSFTADNNTFNITTLPRGGSGVTDTGSTDSFFITSGTVQEKMRIQRYDAVLGFAYDNNALVRPYAAILFSILQGTDEIFFSGSGSECVFPPGVTSCPVQNSTISFASNRSLRSESSIGGIAGVTLNPTEDIGMTIEVQAISDVFYAVSAFVRL